MFRQELSHVNMFKGLSSADLDTLAPHFEAFLMAKDQVAFEQGKVADYLYILLDGEVVVNFKPYDGPPLTIARIQPGGVFGWSAALGRQLYTSTAIACRESTTIRIKGDELRCICEKHPETGVIILERLAGVIADRLQSTRAQIFAMLAQSVDLMGCTCQEDKK
jgi:CRP/FNR family transcriptional regulator, cyclic AMP receptor protein